MSATKATQLLWRSTRMLCLSPFVRAIKDLFLLSILMMHATKSLLSAVFPSDAPLLRDPETSLYQPLDYSSKPGMRQLNQ